MVLSRRLGSIAMCFAMLPLLVLAALPVIYCQESSGHVALEFVADNATHWQEHSNSNDPSAIEDNCTDSSLTDVLSAPRASKLLPTPPQVANTIFNPIINERRSSGFFPRIVRLDPHLSTLWTVILRL